MRRLRQYMRNMKRVHFGWVGRFLTRRLASRFGDLLSSVATADARTAIYWD